MRSLPEPRLGVCTRQELLDYFDNAWTLTELLFSSLQGDEAFYRPPYHQIRHPMIFYYCHPASLYINKFRVAGLLKAPLNADFEQLFETGVDEMSWDDLGKNEQAWPSVREIREYRRKVYALVRQVLETHPGFERPPITERSPLWAVLMGIEHERIHLELSAVLIRELPQSLVRRPEAWPPEHPSGAATSESPPEPGRDYPRNEWIGVEAGEAVVGKPRDWPSYGWDNEVGERRFRVSGFEASRFLVTNGEFWQFVAAGGYLEPRYWSESGWAWRTYRNVKWPTFWVPDGPAGLHHYRLRLCFDTLPMPWAWPAEVNWYEAKAYCAWLSERDGRVCRLLTEPEHHRISPRPRRMGAPPPSPGQGSEAPGPPILGSAPFSNPGSPEGQRPFGGGLGAEPPSAFNLELRWGSPSPVDALPPNPAGFHDARGNVWQWCEDHFAALPGFEVHRLYEDFSTPCFDGKHQLILGGSFVSTGDEASVWARFQFRPHFFQHAGLRLVRPAADERRPETSCMDAPPPHVGSGPCCSSVERPQGNVYESRQMLAEYLLLHFGTGEETGLSRFVSPEVLHFPRRCAERLSEAALRLGAGHGRALDIGCAVGGSAFELGRSFREVEALDLSQSFIDAARALARDGSLAYERKDEGELRRELTARVAPELDRSRVSFRQADACSLPSELRDFDAVLIANVLCRLPSPRALLSRLSGPRALVRSGGVVLFTTPWTWMEQFTPKSAWLGGYEKDGREIRSLDGLREELEPEFELIEADEMPLLIREHARKFQLIVAQSTLWRRR